MPSELPSDKPMPSQPYRVASLGSRKVTRFAFRPEAGDRATIAAALGLLKLPSFSFVGELTPEGRHDYRLSATLLADVVQPCSISLAPVPGKVSESVARRYLADYADPDGDEIEMASDADEREPLPEVIDVAEIAVEALALALPLYPRAPGVELGEAVFTEPGVDPLRQADLNPFAALADKLKAAGGKTDADK